MLGLHRSGAVVQLLRGGVSATPSTASRCLFGVCRVGHGRPQVRTVAHKPAKRGSPASNAVPRPRPVRATSEATAAAAGGSAAGSSARRFVAENWPYGVLGGIVAGLGYFTYTSYGAFRIHPLFLLCLYLLSLRLWLKPIRVFCCLDDPAENGTDPVTRIQAALDDFFSNVEQYSDPDPDLFRVEYLQVGKITAMVPVSPTQ